jgi:hypothetical protein
LARITVHIGHFGSGKTEISLEKAMAMARRGEKVSLVDLDNVNPYFRSGEKSEELNRLGITVYTPTFEGTTVDVPSLPAQIQQVFVQQDRRVIFDAGGDPTGAAVLGRYHRMMEEDDVETLCVVNTLRPWTRTVEDILWMMQEMSAASRLPINGIIHNSNLARETLPAHVVEGQALVEEAARRSGVPVVAIYAMEPVLRGLPRDFADRYGPLLRPLTLKMRPQWLDQSDD